MTIVTNDGTIGFFVMTCRGSGVGESRPARNEGRAALWFKGGAEEKTRSNKLSQRARRMPAERFSESTANLAITHFRVDRRLTGTYMIDDTGIVWELVPLQNQCTERKGRAYHVALVVHRQSLGSAPARGYSFLVRLRR